MVDANGIPQNPFALCAEIVLTVNDLTSGCQAQLNVTINGPAEDVEGCTDPAARYNSEATLDDNSCVYPENPTTLRQQDYLWITSFTIESYSIGQHHLLRHPIYDYREVGTTSWTVMSAVLLTLTPLQEQVEHVTLWSQLLLTSGT